MTEKIKPGAFYKQNKTVNLSLKAHNLVIRDSTKDFLLQDTDRENEICPGTLRDISMLLYMAVGQGACWNLAYEISQRTGCDYDKVAIAIDDIVEEYSYMTEKEGYSKMVDKPTPSKEYFERSDLKHEEVRMRKLYDESEEEQSGKQNRDA